MMYFDSIQVKSAEQIDHKNIEQQIIKIFKYNKIQVKSIMCRQKYMTKHCMIILEKP